jgi:hypothetical protein
MAATNKRAHALLTTVEEALDHFWKCKGLPGKIPDYLGFSTWVIKKIEADRRKAVPLHMQTEAIPSILLIVEIVKAAKNAGIAITRDGPVPQREKFGISDGKRSKIKAFNKAKLLLSFLNNLPERQRHLYFKMSSRLEGTHDEVPVSQDSPQFDHRVAFFDAVRNGDAHLAFKMLGRLREEAHDSGELEFLEATAFFQENRFREAIEHARRVSKDDIDGPRAVMLILEAYALEGDIDLVARELNGSSDVTLPSHFIAYLCQLAVANSSDPEGSANKAIALIHDVPAREESQGIFQAWNRYSCQVALRAVEYRQQLALRALAVEQSGGDINSVDASADLPLRMRQVDYALAMDPDMVKRLAPCELDDAYKEIVKRLLNAGHRGRRDFVQALMTQWRIGDRVVFLGNVLSNLSGLKSWKRDADDWQLIRWAYQEAVVQSREADADLLRKELITSATGAAWLQEAAALSATDLLERSLSPMGKLALSSARWDLAQFDKDGANLWKDAGMISLGFFRVVELEFNERLIFPALRSVDIKTLENELDTLESVGERKAVEFWKRMVPALRKAKDLRHGLDLGTLEILLQKVRTVSGSDIPLKAAVNSGIFRQLSVTGAAAFHSGELSKLLSVEAREQFRNPAAHTRYVGLETARQCKIYVENALQKLVEYTTNNGVDATVH